MGEIDVGVGEEHRVWYQEPERLEGYFACLVPDPFSTVGTFRTFPLTLCVGGDVSIQSQKRILIDNILLRPSMVRELSTTNSK